MPLPPGDGILELTGDLPLSKFGKVAKNVLTERLVDEVEAAT